MTIETLLKENTAALVRLAEVLGDLVEATARDDQATEAPAPAPTAEPTKGPTRAEVSYQINQVASKLGRDAAVEILKAHGSAKLGEVSEAAYADIMAACSNLLAGATHG